MSTARLPEGAQLPLPGSARSAKVATMNRLTIHRVILWAVLLLFAAWFLAPLYVMVVTSLKDMDQVRNGHLLSLPTDPTLASWAKA